MITARNIEAGQVAQAAQMAFILAEDGPRDAVFSVFESVFSPTQPDLNRPLSCRRPLVKALGKVREVSPVVDAKTGTVSVKVEIDAVRPGPAARRGRGWHRTRGAWIMSSFCPGPLVAKKRQAGGLGSRSRYNPCPLRPVTVARYEKERIVLDGGLKPGESVVTEGGKFLREGQIVVPRRPEQS